MEEWMGCGSMEETHIKVDTGHIMSGKWSGLTGLGLRLWHLSQASSRLESVNADRLLHRGQPASTKGNLSNKGKEGWRMVMYLEFLAEVRTPFTAAVSPIFKPKCVGFGRFEIPTSWEKEGHSSSFLIPSRQEQFIFDLQYVYLLFNYMVVSKRNAR